MENACANGDGAIVLTAKMAGINKSLPSVCSIRSEAGGIHVCINTVVLQHQFQLLPYLRLDVVALVRGSALPPTRLPTQLKVKRADESVRRDMDVAFDDFGGVVLHVLGHLARSHRERVAFW